MCTVSKIFSRTTGIRKYLVKEGKERRLNDIRLLTLLEAYFHKYQKSIKN